MATEKLTAALNIMLTPADRQRIVEAAEKARRKPSDYARTILLIELDKSDG